MPEPVEPDASTAAPDAAPTPTPRKAPPPEFRVDRGGARAVLVVPATADPEALTVDALRRGAADAGIVVDDDVTARLEALVRAFRAERARLEETIAVETPPEHGEDGRLEWFEGCAPLLSCTPRADASGAVDHYACTSYRCVSEGVGIARIHPPTPGRDGRDVTGQPIQARPGQPFAVRLSDALQLREDGVIVATSSGLLEMRGSDVRISPLFEVSGAVDFSTGHVIFDGAVVVKEGVRDRFIVDCTGDLVVQGLVQAASIRCGGDFTCAQGMVGRGRGRIEVQGGADAGHLNGVRGVVHGSVAVKREIIDCRLVIGGDLLAEQAALIGGETVVGGTARLGAIGARGGKPTTLILGAAAPLVAEHRAAREQRQALRDRLDALERTRAALQGSGRRARSADARARLDALAEEITDLEQELQLADSLASSLEARCAEAREPGERGVDVRNAIHPGVRLLLGPWTVQFTETMAGPVRVGGGPATAPWCRFGDGARSDLAGTVTVSRAAA